MEVTCFEYEGINAIKRALKSAEADNGPDNHIKVRLVASPHFIMTNTCLDQKLGIKRLEDAIETIRTNIEAEGGSLKVKRAPWAPNETDDLELQALLERRARENAEVSGDESGSEDDGRVLA